jgi:hypothetical protein
MEYVSLEGLRLDGRRPKEVRQTRCGLSVLPNADGSAMFEMGNTKVLAAVYGPREAGPHAPCCALISGRRVNLSMACSCSPLVSCACQNTSVAYVCPCPAAFARRAMLSSAQGWHPHHLIQAAVYGPREAGPHAPGCALIGGRRMVHSVACSCSSVLLCACPSTCITCACPCLAAFPRSAMPSSAALGWHPHQKNEMYRCTRTRRVSPKPAAAVRLTLVDARSAMS